MAGKKFTKTCPQCGDDFTRRFSHYVCCSLSCAVRYRKGDATARFWRNVAKSDDPKGCWLWTGKPNSNGYGVLRGDQGVDVRAHRFSYELHNGPIPDGLFACHRCDVRLCVNPAHIFPGTQQENLDDAISKGRMSNGEKRWNAKLTDAAIVAIRADTRTQQAIANDHGIDRALVSYIKARKIWKHVV